MICQMTHTGCLPFSIVLIAFHALGRDKIDLWGFSSLFSMRNLSKISENLQLEASE